MIETEITLNLPEGPIRVWVNPETRITRMANPDGSEWGSPAWYRGWEGVRAGVFTFKCDRNCYGHTEFFLPR